MTKRTLCASLCVGCAQPDELDQNKTNDCNCIYNLQQGENKLKKHINQWASVHEWGVRGGEFEIAKSYFNACLECIAHYNGNVSKYVEDIDDKATLKRSTVRVYMATMMTLARKYKRYEMLEDMIIGLGYATVTWSEIRAVAKSHGKKAKNQPTKKAPRASYTKQQQVLRKSKAYLALPKSQRDAIDLAMAKENKRNAK